MRINSIPNSQISFGKIIVGKSITKVLQSERPSNAFVYEFDKIEEALNMIGAQHKENVDVILNHKPGEGFYGIISSKKQGVPNNPAYKCKISPKYADISIFSNWLNTWDEAYSEKALENWHKLMNIIKNLAKK